MFHMLSVGQRGNANPLKFNLYFVYLFQVKYAIIMHSRYCRIGICIYELIMFAINLSNVQNILNTYNLYI